MAVEAWQRAGVLDAVERASDTGEPVTRAGLQEVLGIGSGDLQAVLSVLMDEGRVSEVAPGEYEAPSRDEGELRAGGAAWGGAGAARGPPAPAPGTGAQRAAAAVRHLGRQAPGADGEERVTVLSKAMVESLPPEALGNLVLAGVQAEDGAFLLRIEP